MTCDEILHLTFPEPEPPAGRQDDFRLLEEKLRDARQCIILLGPRGAGKSTLLNSFFSPEYRLRAARENRQLFTAPARYPAHMTYNEVYAFFSDMIVQACLWALPACGEAETLAALQSELLSRSYMSTGAAKMQSLVGLLHRQGWAVSLVLDNFELFTSSREVKREHHGVMNELVDQKGLRLVAATDYDLDATSLTSEGVGSLLIQKFGAGNMTLRGLDREAFLQLGRGLEEARGLPALSDKELSAAWQISGGLPVLGQEILRRFWAVRAGGENIAPHLKECIDQTLEQSRHLMDTWCSGLTQAQREVLRELQAGCDSRPHINTEAWEQAAAALANRGLLSHTQEGYDYNSLLFQRYCENCLSPSLQPAPTEGDLLSHLLSAAAQGQTREVTGRFGMLDEESKLRLLDYLLSQSDPESSVEAEEYQALGISEEQLRRLSSRLLEALNDAIRACRPSKLLHSIPDASRPVCDYALYTTGFTRVCEQQVRECLYPIIARWPWPDQLPALLSWPEGRSFFLRGDSSLSLSNYKYFLQLGADKLAQLCAARGMEELDAGWWTRLSEDLDTYRNTRNSISHPGHFMTYLEARSLLDVVFRRDQLMAHLSEANLLAIRLQEQPEASQD